MKVPLSWLKEYVEIDLSPLELANRLTFAGLEVEEATFVGLPVPEQAQETKIEGFAWDRDKIVVGAVTEVLPHPNADRLALARVDDGEGVHEAVTGAPNILELIGAGPLKTSLKVAFAREGARLLDAYKPERPVTILKRARIRGVESRTMICSERELGLSDEHEGVIVLDPDAPLGTPLADYMGDVVFDIAITPNQARNANILGVARETAALIGAQLRPPSFSITAHGPEMAGQARIRILEPDLNPRFVLALIRDVEIKPSPYLVQRRLRLAGMRPINNIVDVTNYVMMELGQPLHAFDYDVLKQRAGGKPPTIITRLPKNGETLTTLDDVTRRLDDFTILVCDEAGPLSLGGIIGGAESEVSEKTTDVLLEGASWEFINIRRTLQSQKVDSEAGYRFSRGVHRAMAERGVRRAIELMRTLSGGEVAKGLVDEYPRPAKAVLVDLPLAEIRRILGISIEPERVVSILESLEFKVTVKGDALDVEVPDHRLDIGTGVVGRADLIEEVARIYGYDRIPETQISDTIPPQRENAPVTREERIRDILVECGLQEVVSYRLTTAEREQRAVAPGADADAAEYVTLENPITTDRVLLRRGLLPSTLEILARNAKLRERLALFEIGPVFLPRECHELPDENLRLTLAMTGPRSERHWQASDGGAVDFFDLKGVVEALAEGLHLDVRFEPDCHPSLHPGKCARLLVGGADAGRLGELHPEVASEYGLQAAVGAADLDLDILIAAASDRFEIEPVMTHPPVLEDLALIVDESVPAARVQALAAQAGGPLVAEVRLFDVYRGEQIGAGRKSLAYSLTYQADKNLSDAEVAKIRKRIVKRLESELGAKLRGSATRAGGSATPRP